ncbi:MAG: N-acetylneuraminate lyase [Eubacteriales bacterium]
MFKPGIYAALVTPYTVDGEVDYMELKKMTRHLINQGLEGMYVCGSTGEAFMLNLEERKKVLEAVIEENKGETTIVCHCGCISTKEMVELAKHAEQAGADAVSSVPPFYYKFTQEEIVTYYIDLANAVEVPVIVYNFPAFSGVSFTMEMFERLFSAKSNLCALKHTSFDFYTLERIKDKYPNVTIFNGHDEVSLSGLAIGADGAIGSTFNAIPKVYLKIRESVENKDMEGARKAQKDANDFIDVLLKYGGIQVIKEFMTHYGFNGNGTRKPFLPISEEGKVAVKSLYEYYRANYDL